MAVVETYTGCSVGAEELSTLCRKHLAAFKVPKVFSFQLFSRDPTDKLNKTLLCQSVQDLLRNKPHYDEEYKMTQDNQPAKIEDFLQFIGEEGTLPVVAQVPGAAPFIFCNECLSHVAACKSSVSFLDGTSGKLLYCEQLIEEAVDALSFEALASLLYFGESVPSAVHLSWQQVVLESMTLCDQLRHTLAGLPSELDPVYALSIALAMLPNTDKFLN